MRLNLMIFRYSLNSGSGFLAPSAENRARQITWGTVFGGAFITGESNETIR